MPATNSLFVDTSGWATYLDRREPLHRQTRATYQRAVASKRHVVTTNYIIAELIALNEPEPWLKKQQLLRNGKPTVAGVLLFSDEPQAIMPKRCGVKIYRYKTKDAAGTRETLAFDPISIKAVFTIKSS